MRNLLYTTGGPLPLPIINQGRRGHRFLLHAPGRCMALDELGRTNSEGSLRLETPSVQLILDEEAASTTTYRLGTCTPKRKPWLDGNNVGNVLVHLIAHTKEFSTTYKNCHLAITYHSNFKHEHPSTPPQNTWRPSVRSSEANPFGATKRDGKASASRISKPS